MNETHGSLLMLQFLQAAYWFDEAMRKEQLRRKAIVLPRAQSILLMNVALGIRKPSQLADAMGVSRQAISRIVSDLVDAGMLITSPDPEDGRGMLLDLDESNQGDADFVIETMRLMERQLGDIIGEDRLAVIRTALAMHWGAPRVLRPDEGDV